MGYKRKDVEQTKQYAKSLCATKKERRNTALG